MEIIDVISSVSTILVTAITVFAGLKAFSTIKQKDAEVEKSLELIRTKEKFVGNETDKTEAVKRTIEEEKYSLFLQYHIQGLSQSKISFWFSLIFAAIGFAIIVTGILTVQRDVSLWSQGKAFITIISGTIVDAVSALFFVQSNKARQLMIDFFDKLRTDRKFEESLKLANEIPDVKLQSKLKIVLAMNFAEIKSDSSIIASILNDDIQQK